ncbi:MAG: fatty acid desaturase [Flavobacteriales bacterium]|nr:fatty acid desaturase [Flavobacteriales bacterium]
MWTIIIFLIAHHFLSLFTQTFFHHRYAAHEMFTMSKSWEKVFFVCSWLFQGASYLSPKTYAILHRMHQAYVDTEKDVHSPKHDKNIWRMMHKTKTIYSLIHDGEMKVEERFLGNLPEWGWFDKFAYAWPSRIFWMLLYVAFYIQFATHWWMYIFIVAHILMSVIHGGIINWFAHRIGYRNHDVDDTSTNMFPIDIFMLGEGLHNNHHKMGTRANFAQKWFEADPVYLIILIFNGLRIIQLKK